MSASLVVVVGAGPAGCAAAYDLARAGHRVLLADRRGFPRQKACAGALTLKAARALRYSVRPVVRTVCRTLHVSRGGGGVERHHGPLALCLMTVRAELDDYCLRRTLEAGAELALVRRIDAVRELPGRVELETSEGGLDCAFLVGADGANSRVRHLSGEFPAAEMGFAIEASVDEPAARTAAAEFDFGATPHGYGWLFPKRDHVNVGIYSTDAPGALDPAQLMAYAATKLQGAELRSIQGHPVGLGGRRYRPAARRIFLVGDAAGLVFPDWGEGIFNAIRSGQLAAAAIAGELSGGGLAVEAFRRGLRPIRAELARRSTTA